MGGAAAARLPFKEGWLAEVHNLFAPRAPPPPPAALVADAQWQWAARRAREAAVAAMAAEAGALEAPAASRHARRLRRLQRALLLPA